MNGFEAMNDGDLILCVNLLISDARAYEQMSDRPENQEILRARAADRRALAAKMKAEVDRRGNAIAAVLATPQETPLPHRH